MDDVLAAPIKLVPKIIRSKVDQTDILIKLLMEYQSIEIDLLIRKYDIEEEVIQDCLKKGIICESRSGFVQLV